METTFLFIRHGATSHLGHIVSGRAAGVHLNDEGRREAKGLVDRLKHLRITAVYSSPLERTMETAQPLASHLRLDIRQSEAFLEIDFGQWTSMRLDELHLVPLWHPFNSFRSGTRALGGELIVEVQARVVVEIDRLRGIHPGETIAIFCHSDVIKYALAYYAGIPLDFASRLHIDTASVSVLGLSEFAPRLISLNDTGRPLLS